MLESHSKPESLADMFKKKKATFSKKLEERQASIPAVDSLKKERTKEDILKQRKQMMKAPDFI